MIQILRGLGCFVVGWVGIGFFYLVATYAGRALAWIDALQPPWDFIAIVSLVLGFFAIVFGIVGPPPAHWPD